MTLSRMTISRVTLIRMTFIIMAQHYNKLLGAYHKVGNLKDASFGKALALPTNIRLGWKGLAGTDTLTYYEHL
jgi:hypothetical protein